VKSGVTVQLAQAWAQVNVADGEIVLGDRRVSGHTARVSITLMRDKAAPRRQPVQCRNSSPLRLSSVLLSRK
jgi:hypothetical protein